MAEGFARSAAVPLDLGGLEASRRAWRPHLPYLHDGAGRVVHEAILPGGGAVSASAQQAPASDEGPVRRRAFLISRNLFPCIGPPVVELFFHRRMVCNGKPRISSGLAENEALILIGSPGVHHASFRLLSPLRPFPFPPPCRCGWRLTDQPLVDAAWLQAHIGKPGLVVIDVRDAAKDQPNPM